MASPKFRFEEERFTKGIEARPGGREFNYSEEVRGFLGEVFSRKHPNVSTQLIDIFKGLPKKQSDELLQDLKDSIKQAPKDKTEAKEEWLERASDMADSWRLEGVGK